MKAYLLINRNTGADFLPYAEQYRVYLDRELCLDDARMLGWDNKFLGFNDTVGIANNVMCGDVNVTVMPIEINERTYQ